MKKVIHITRLFTMDTTKAATFRFKFTDEFAERLYAFAQLHRYDNRIVFKEAWEKWSEDHRNDIELETQHLKENGYTGATLDKMYKSARYYFRKKSTEKNEPKARRPYVSVDIDVIEHMDIHIMDWCRRSDFRPAIAFSDFCETHKSLLEKEVLRLYDEGNMNTSDIPTKLKKTYKNRYYQKVKAPSL